MTEEEKEVYASIVRIYGTEDAMKMFELAKAFANAGTEKEGNESPPVHYLFFNDC